MKKYLTIIEKIFQIILIIIIIINLISIISVKVLKNSYPKIFGFSYFSVVSGSMEPTIKVGDEIIVKLTDDIKEDDIIIYEEEGSFVTHRLIERNGNKLITQGDNNLSPDNEMNINVVVGKVIFTIPYFGKVKYVIANRYFLIVLIACYVIYEIIMNKVEKKK